MNEQNRMRRSRVSRHKVTPASVVAVDDVAERAMRKYRWERRGWLGRLVRTQRAGIVLPDQHDERADEGLPSESRIAR